MMENGERPRTTQRRLWLWLGYWVSLFSATHLPLPPKETVRLPYGDKVLHFALYFVLAWLGGRRLASTLDPRPIAARLAWAGVYVLFAAFDEWLQQFVGRHMSLHDWLADVSGVAAATLILIGRQKSRTLSEP